MCAEAERERSRIGAIESELVGVAPPAFVAVGGADHESDVVPPVDGDAGDSEIGRGLAAADLRGWVEAQQFLDGIVDEVGVVTKEPALVGVAGDATSVLPSIPVTVSCPAKSRNAIMATISSSSSGC